MITCYFGVPGVGKNTMLTKFARREIRRQKLSKIFPFIQAYDHVYTDFFVKGAEVFEYDYIKKYKMYNSLILIEEMGINADNRKFKSFTDEERDFYTLHRHIGCDLIYATQDYSKVDAKVRQLTQELWYMSKTVVPIFKHFTSAKRIYRAITINEHLGELTLGYRFCNIIESLFVSNFKLCFRPLYYRYFDSFDEGSLKQRPELVSIPWGSAVTDTEESNPPTSSPPAPKSTEGRAGRIKSKVGKVLQQLNQLAKKKLLKK